MFHAILLGLGLGAAEGLGRAAIRGVRPRGRSPTLGPGAVVGGCLVVLVPIVLFIVFLVWVLS